MAQWLECCYYIDIVGFLSLSALETYEKCMLLACIVGVSCSVCGAFYCIWNKVIQIVLKKLRAESNFWSAM